MRKLVLGLAALSSTAVAQPQFSAERMERDTKTLASDAFEGRAPGTPGEEKTVAYLTQQMQAAGLQPAGDPEGAGRSWFQKVPLLRAQIGDAAPTLVMTIAGQPTRLTQGEQIAVRAPLTGQRHVNMNNVPLVFVGYGVSAPERRWDDFKGVDVRGKMIVVLVNDPDFESGQGDFGGKAMTYYGRWTYKYEEAARRGAAGVMIVHETAPAAYGWNTVKSSNTVPAFDIVRSDPKAVHTPFESWITREQAAAVFQASGLNFEAEKRRAQTRAFRPVPLKASFSADYDVDAQTIVSRNVAGILPGAKRPDELIIYSAHWDHYGVGDPDATGDRIYNGALDNASGTAEMLELARAFVAGPRPERSLLFLAVTAEERGLLGSEYYAANPLYPLARTVGVINTDGANLVGPARDFSISGTARLELLDKLTRIAAARGRAFAPDPRPEQGGFYRSDHFPLAKRGVPAISFKTGDDLVQGGKARGEAIVAAYLKDDYHQPSDEWKEGWTFAGAVEDLGLLHALGLDLANGTDWPNWAPDSEFRAARDAMRR